MIGFFFTPKRRVRPGGPSGLPDTMPPFLAALSVGADLQSFSVLSNEAGTLNWAVDGTSSYPDLAALLAASGGAVGAGSELVTSGISTITVDLTGLGPGNWWVHVSVVDAAGNASLVASVSVPAAVETLEFNTDQLEWNGDQLIFNAA